ncbi:hypothetical protein ACMD2_03628 [Ananas comosus]|nr:hypothetical protein ACMD2_03628 [Ananas comosus]
MSLLETAEAIEQALSSENTAFVVRDEGERRAVRVKIVVSKQQLKQMAQLIGCGRGGTEQLLQLLRRLQVQSKLLDATAKGRRDRWRPALQSIPEEVREL